MTAKKAAAPEPSAEVDDNLSGLVVKGAAIQVAVGSQVLQFSEGDVLPKGVDDKDVERLTRRGLIEKQ